MKNNPQMITKGDGLTTYKPKFIDILRSVKNSLVSFCYSVKFYSRLRCHRAKRKGVYYFIFNPNVRHPGLADRLKAIVSSYNVAKSNGYEYKLFFETPFRLFDYLEPQFDMFMSLSDLEYSIIDTRLTRERYCEKLIRLKSNKQYLCLEYEGHTMPRVLPNTGRKWCDVFHEMFRPSDRLENAYKALNIPEHTYVSCHLRFVNALEKFENTFFDNHLETEEERQALIARCKQGIQEIIDVNPGKDVYVFSDSKVFLGLLSDLHVKVLPCENIAHVGKDVNEDGVMKTFLDLYLMSKGDAVYRCCAPELYSISHYAMLAATVGDIPFYDQTI